MLYILCTSHWRRKCLFLYLTAGSWNISQAFNINNNLSNNKRKKNYDKCPKTFVLQLEEDIFFSLGWSHCLRRYVKRRREKMSKCQGFVLCETFYWQKVSLSCDYHIIYIIDICLFLLLFFNNPVFVFVFQKSQRW